MALWASMDISANTAVAACLTLGTSAAGAFVGWLSRPGAPGQRETEMAPVDVKQYCRIDGCIDHGQCNWRYLLWDQSLTRLLLIGSTVFILWVVQITPAALLLEKVRDIWLHYIRTVMGRVYRRRGLSVHLINDTGATLQLAGKRHVLKGDLIASFKQLHPGHAGTIHFWGDGEYSGAAALAFDSGSYLLIGTAQAWLQEPRFNLVSSKRADWHLKKFMKALPRGLPRCAQTSCISGQDCAALVHHVVHGDASEIDLLLTPSTHVPHILSEILALDSYHQLNFASWCQEHAEGCLGDALFIMEFAGVRSGIPGARLEEQVFALDLLIGSFVVFGIVSIAREDLCDVIGLWENMRKSFGMGDGSLNQYSAYSQLLVGRKTLGRYADAAHSLLRAAALKSALVLAQHVETCKSEGNWPPQRFMGDAGLVRTLTASSSMSSSSELLARHLSGELTKKATSRRDGSINTREHRGLPADVKCCIHKSAEFSLRRCNLFCALGRSQRTKEAKNALEHYCRSQSLTKRTFGRGKDMAVSNGCSKYGFTTFGTDAFDRLCESEELKHMCSSLGNAAPDYKVLTTNSKSGSFFFFSFDERFVVKTISDEEASLLRRMWPAYRDHLSRFPGSLLSRFMGVYGIQMSGKKVIHFLIMQSIFDPGRTIHEIHDLKGSTFNRKKRPHEKIGKDNDWMAAGLKLRFTESARREFLANHELDSEFLMRFGVMDYSLLVGIHRMESASKVDSEWYQSNGMQVRGERDLCFVGLIDFLIKYGSKKRLENLVKSFRGHYEDASCTDPESYALRQVRFVRDRVAIKKEPDKDFGNAGILRIHIVSGHDLVCADGPFGQSDPYVSAKLGLQQVRTHSIHCTIHPEWNRMDCTEWDLELFLPVNQDHLNRYLELSVWDEDDRATQGSDDFLGKLYIPMDRLVRERHLALRERLLDTTNGELSARVSFEPLSPS